MSSPIRKVTLFVIISYGFAWAFWIPWALISQGVWNAPASVESFLSSGLNPAAWGPLIAAVVVSFLDHGPSGVAGLLRRGLKVRLGRWWVPALLLFPVLIGGALLVGTALGDPEPELEMLAQPALLPIVFVYIFFLTGPLQEEFGWRGVIFEELRQRHMALTAALMAGLAWGLWHLPLFWVPRAEFYYNRPLWGLLLTTLLVGIIIAWIYANTGGSVFAAMVAHASFNWSHAVFPTLGADIAALLLFGFYGIVVVWIVVAYGRKTLQPGALR